MHFLMFMLQCTAQKAGGMWNRLLLARLYVPDGRRHSSVNINTFSQLLLLMIPSELDIFPAQKVMFREEYMDGLLNYHDGWVMTLCSWYKFYKVNNQKLIRACKKHETYFFINYDMMYCYETERNLPIVTTCECWQNDKCDEMIEIQILFKDVYIDCTEILDINAWILID